MSDDEKAKKDKSKKPENNTESEPITENTSAENEVEKTEETTVEATTEEATIEAATEETPAEETQTEEATPVQEEPKEEPPAVEANAVEEPVVAPEPEPEPQPEANNVVQPDQVVNNNNNSNNTNSNTTAKTEVNNGEPPKKKGMAIWTLILAVIGFFTGFILIGGLFDLIAIILAIIVLAKKKDGKGLAITGLIIAIIGIIGTIIWSIVLVPALAVLGIGVGLVSNYDDIVDAGEDIYGYATNIIEEVNNEYDFSNYIFDYNTTSENTTSSNSVSSNTTNTTSSNTTTKSAETHNKTFDYTIGTGKSSLSVHTFLIGVKTNNLTTSTAQKIGICYVTSSDSYKKNDNSNTTIDAATLKEDGVYLDYCKAAPTATELDDMNFTCNEDDISAISKHLDTSKKYTVKVANTKEYVSTSATDVGFKSGIAKGSTGGLYDSGYYRLIYIYEEN